MDRELAARSSRSIKRRVRKRYGRIGASAFTLPIHSSRPSARDFPLKRARLRREEEEEEERALFNDCALSRLLNVVDDGPLRRTGDAF